MYVCGGGWGTLGEVLVVCWCGEVGSWFVGEVGKEVVERACVWAVGEWREE